MNSMEQNTRVRGEAKRPPATRDWLRDHARKLSAKELARVTDLSVKRAEKVRSGENSISVEALTKWLSNDVGLAAAYAHHIGLILPGDVEQVEALMRLAAAFGRRG